MKPTLAIIQFPGSNCEYETLEAASFYGFDAKICRWNESDTTWLSRADAYIIPGGFSFQDRVRAGAIAAKLPVMDVLQEADSKGKPILGICNGCQILAEAGFFPNIAGQYHIEAALAPNTKAGKLNGFICDWVFVKVQGTGSLFTSAFNAEDILPIPINHGEGRFVFSAPIPDSASRFVYCDENGKVSPDFPINPNGAQGNVAGITNAKGNVMAMMPHPERAAFLRQIPVSVVSSWSKQKQEAFKRAETVSAGPWGKLFEAVLESVKVRV
jgi:phosphoribosylformylglycinamidine synthase I